LGLIFVCLAAGIVAAGYFYYRNYEKHYRSEVERQLFAIAELKVGELVQWRKERLGDAGSLFKNAPFAALVRRFFEQPEDVDARRQLQGWIGKIQTSHQYDHVFLLDARGIERLAVPDSSEPVPVHLADNAVKVLHSGQVTFLDFHRDAPDRPIYLGVLVPILDESEASPPLGVLVLRIDPATYLYPLLQRWPTPSLTAETLLVRREGNEVVFLNELRFQKNTALTLRAPLDQKALPAARAALGQEGVMEGIDYRGVPVVAALRVIPDCRGLWSPAWMPRKCMRRCESDSGKWSFSSGRCSSARGREPAGYGGSSASGSTGKGRRRKIEPDAWRRW